MLKENQDARPNIYQVLKESCVMQGKDAPVKDVSGLLDKAKFCSAYTRFSQHF